MCRVEWSDSLFPYTTCPGGDRIQAEMWECVAGKFKRRWDSNQAEDPQGAPNLWIYTKLLSFLLSSFFFSLKCKAPGFDDHELCGCVGMDTYIYVMTQVSYDILSSEEERRLYDWSLYRLQSPGVYAWPYQSDITQSTYGPFPTEVPIFAIQSFSQLHL